MCEVAAEVVEGPWKARSGPERRAWVDAEGMEKDVVYNSRDEVENGLFYS